MSKQPAQHALAPNRVQFIFRSGQTGFKGPGPSHWDDPVPQPLVWPVGIKEACILLNDVIEMPEAETHEVVQAPALE